MRHFRMPNQNLKNLVILQKHIGSILKEISQDEERNKSTSQNLLEGDATEKNRRHELGNASKSKSVAKKRKHISCKRTYFCRTCNVSSRNKKKHLHHLNTHEFSPLSCFKCKVTFKNLDAFKWHLQYSCNLKLKKRLHKCNQCYMQFRSKRDLQKHMEGHRRNNCSYCSKRLTRRKDLIKHLIECHSIELERYLFKCDECGKTFLKKQSLYYHWQQHQKDSIVCLQCGHISDSFEASEGHMKQHADQKQFTCSICNFKLSLKQHYVNHMKLHNLYKCITCDESFGSREKVLRHKQRGHVVEGLHPRFLCPYCPSSYHQKNKLQQHITKHKGVGPTIECKHCEKSFRTLTLYFKHCLTLSHQQLIPKPELFDCKICKKQFFQKQHLEGHYSTLHKIVKDPYKCNYCDYTTLYKNNCERHKRLHKNIENAFRCEQCAKTFSTMANLKDHISYNHIQTKSYTCNECNKSFKRGSELNRHKTTHSEDRPHVCKLCGGSFKRVNHLRRHEKSIHKIAHSPRKRVKLPNEENISTKETTQTVQEKVTHISNPSTSNGMDLTLSSESIYSLQPIIYTEPEEFSFISHTNLASSDDKFFVESIASSSYEFLIDLSPQNLIETDSGEVCNADKFP